MNMKHNRIDSTQTHGNGDTGAQEPLPIGDTEGGRRIMKTEHETWSTGNTGHGSMRRQMAGDMWTKVLGDIGHSHRIWGLWIQGFENMGYRDIGTQDTENTGQWDMRDMRIGDEGHRE